MSRIKAVEMLIKKYRKEANAYRTLAEQAEAKVRQYEDYKLILTAPGFTSHKQRFTAPGRVEPYLVVPGNTYED